MVRRENGPENGATACSPESVKQSDFFSLKLCPVDGSTPHFGRDPQVEKTVFYIRGHDWGVRGSVYGYRGS